MIKQFYQSIKGNYNLAIYFYKNDEKIKEVLLYSSNVFEQKFAKLAECINDADTTKAFIVLGDIITTANTLGLTGLIENARKLRLNLKQNNKIDLYNELLAEFNFLQIKIKELQGE